MKCSNLLCTNKAEFVNTKTKQHKCKTCRNKGLDRDAITWFELREDFSDDEPLSIPKPVVKNKYSIVFSGGKWFVYCNDEASFSLSSESQKQAQDFCDSMNEAYRKGVEDALIELKYFSINIRRKHGIIW